MAVPFSRTLRSLRTDRQPWGYAGLTLLLVFPAALVWVFFAKVPVYEVSSKARLEVVAEPQIVAAEVEGRIVEWRLHVGLEVAKGEVLVALDGESERLKMNELRQHMVSTGPRLDAIRKEIDVKRQSLDALVSARKLEAQGSQKQLEITRSHARLAAQNLERVSELAEKNAVALEELEKARAASETAQALIEATQLNVARDEQDRLAEERRQEAELASIQREAFQLENDKKIHDATLLGLQHELEMKSIPAYVAGRIEQVENVGVRAVVRPAQKLATLVPPGESRVVANLPAIAVGRIKRGQRARLRLDGFPWTQYGTLSATVTDIGNEASDDGLIRVDLSVEHDPTSRIPRQHGQTGTVEIEVEQSSPADLIRRAAGEYLMTHRPATGT